MRTAFLCFFWAWIVISDMHFNFQETINNFWSLKNWGSSFFYHRTLWSFEFWWSWGFSAFFSITTQCSIYLNKTQKQFWKKLNKTQSLSSCWDCLIFHSKKIFNTKKWNKKGLTLSLIHIWRCRRYSLCRSRWSPEH